MLDQSAFANRPQSQLPSSLHQPARRFGIVIGLSLAIRLIALYLIRSAPLASDAQDYCQMARQLLSGQSLVPYWPPGVPLYLVPFVAEGAPDWTLRLAILPFWLLCCWGLYRLMSALRLQQHAWLVLLAFSVLPDSIQMSLEPMTQMPAAAFLVLALASAIRAIRAPAIADSILLGCSLGALSLVRPSALPLLAVVPIACCVASRQIKKGLLPLAIGPLIVFSWMACVHQATGKWAINTASAKNMYYGNNPWTPLYKTWYFGSHAKLGSEEIASFPEFSKIMVEADRLPPFDQSAQFQKLASTYIRQHPLLFLARSANRIRCFFGFDTFTGSALQGQAWLGIRLSPIVLAWEAILYMGLVGASIFWMAQASARFWKAPATLLIVTAILIYSLPYWISMSHPTYHFPVLLPIGVLGAMAWSASQPQQPIRASTWLALVAFTAIQIEWVWQMSHAVSTAILR
jgi:hypothetical protein